MADKKPGLLKRIFSFGFGRKKKEEAPEEIPAEIGRASCRERV